ncbi:hypothetical protein [Peribacillus sp. SCS-155]
MNKRVRAVGDLAPNWLLKKAVAVSFMMEFLFSTKTSRLHLIFHGLEERK